MLIVGVVALCLLKAASGQSQRESHGVAAGSSRPQSLRVHYPYNLFSPNGKDWRAQKASFSETLTHSTIDYTKISRAQDHEDVWLYENWFYGLENGVIMESGALDGIKYSTSFFFETFLKWTSIHIGSSSHPPLPPLIYSPLHASLGLLTSSPPHRLFVFLPRSPSCLSAPPPTPLSLPFLIFSTEADPRNYFKLVHQRENSININAALCSETKLLHYTNDEGGQVQGFVEFMSQPFLRKWHPKIFRNITKLDDLMTVQCVQMSRLATELNIREIDIWILDVEGAELSVLQGTNFENLFVKVVVMECDLTDGLRDRQKQEILERNQFTCEQVATSPLLLLASS
jgi:FkbM family methyltransferase